MAAAAAAAPCPVPQTFISKEHEKAAYGQWTPGPTTCNLYDSYGKQVLSNKRTFGAVGFGTSKVCVRTRCTLALWVLLSGLRERLPCGLACMPLAAWGRCTCSRAVDQQAGWGAAAPWHTDRAADCCPPC